MQIPLRVLRSTLLSRCRQIHQQTAGESKDERFVVYSTTDGKTVTSVSGIINIVRTALSPSYFGAVILFEHYEYQEHDVEFRVVLREVNDEITITGDNIRVEQVSNLESDINEFIQRFTDDIVSDWNS
jgi:hypothetical protein